MCLVEMESLWPGLPGNHRSGGGDGAEMAQDTAQLHSDVQGTETEQVEG